MVANLMNVSIASGSIPEEWQTAFVTPVPKVTKPITVSDFRPISVTPILSHLTEKLVVQNYICPVLYTCNTADQFAFRPTGSTSSAMIYLLHKVTAYLEYNNYVRCLLIDFTKAFDVIDRILLLCKVDNLVLPDSVKHWIATFLSNRKQATRVNSAVSILLPTNLGIVQGSVLGPSLFTLMISDLKPVTDQNDMCKYADDLTLIVPENSDVSIEIEFQTIQQWAAANKLMINLSKTKEIVFHRPKPAKPILPPLLNSIERVSVTKLLGILVNDTLSFNPHVHNLLSVCSQRLFL